MNFHVSSTSFKERKRSRKKAKSKPKFPKRSFVTIYDSEGGVEHKFREGKRRPNLAKHLPKVAFDDYNSMFVVVDVSPCDGKWSDDEVKEVQNVIEQLLWDHEVVKEITCLTHAYFENDLSFETAPMAMPLWFKLTD